jgi:hypothetical protein
MSSRINRLTHRWGTHRSNVIGGFCRGPTPGKHARLTTLHAVTPVDSLPHLDLRGVLELVSTCSCPSPEQWGWEAGWHACKHIIYVKHLLGVGGWLGEEVFRALMAADSVSCTGSSALSATLLLTMISPQLLGALGVPASY